jgi:hypothetical protein
MVRCRDVSDELLGMPLYADDPPRVVGGSFHPLDDSVRRARGYLEPSAELIQRLMVHGVHLRGGGAEGVRDA